MKWLAPSHYGLPLLISVGLHALLFALFFIQLPSTPRVPEPVPKHVIAQVIQEENAADKQRKLEAERKRKAQEQARQRELQRQKQVAEEKRRKEQEQKRIAEQKKRDEAKALQQKQQAEKQAKEKAEKELAQKKLAEERAREQQRQEQLLLEQMAQEQAAQELKAQQEALKQAELAAAREADAIEKIRAKVSAAWSYPPGVRHDQQVNLRIGLVPTGQVVNVTIVKSSGNAALDRSVEQAIYKASPLPVPDDPRLFERSFRNFLFTFRPENATW